MSYKTTNGINIFVETSFIILSGKGETFQNLLLYFGGNPQNLVRLGVNVIKFFWPVNLSLQAQLQKEMCVPNCKTISQQF